MKIYLFYLFCLLTLISLLFVNCNKNNDAFTDVQLSSNNVNLRMNIVPTYKGMYVDNFFLIYGDTAKENKLLRYCQKYSYNALTIYDLDIVFNGTKNNYPALSKFIKKARTQYGIKEIVAVRETGSQFTNSTNNYNISRVDTNERFTGFNLEKEWWNNACTFTTYSSYLKTMYTVAQASTPKLKSETYIGWFANPTGQDVKQATKLITYTNRILVHDYRTAPDFLYLEDRLTALNTAAKNLNKTVDIIIIFSAEPVFMQNYYKTNTLNDAYNALYQQYLLSTIDKSNINIIGYQIFCYTFIQQAIKP